LIRNAAKLADEDKNLNLYDLSIITTLNVKTIINGFKKINYNKFEIKPEKKSINKYVIGGIIIIIMLPMLFQMGYM